MNTDNAVQHNFMRCTTGNSDKVYNSMLERITGRYAYRIVAEYGRTDGVLKELVKGQYASLTAAREEYHKLVNEKLNKGYRERPVNPIQVVNQRIQEVQGNTERRKAARRAERIEENIAAGVRRIDFDL